MVKSVEGSLVDRTGCFTVYQDSTIGHYTLEYDPDMFAFPFNWSCEIIAVMPFFFESILKGNMAVIVSSKSLLLPAGWYVDLSPGTTVHTSSAEKIPFHSMVETGT